MHQLALTRAEDGDWHELCDLAENLPHSIMVADDFGMLPLHWACTEPTVPLATLELLLRVFPAAAETKNLSGMLPLHVAIANKLPAVHLNCLVTVFPGAVFVKGGDDLFPAEMARKHRLPEHSVNVLKKSVSLPDRRASLGARMSSVGASLSLHRLPSEATRCRRTALVDSSSLKSFNRSPSQASTTSSVLSRSALEGQRAMSQSTSSASLRSLDAMDDAIEYISTDLRDLTGQLASLGTALRAAPRVRNVLWNPGDRLGMALDCVEDGIGARIKRFTGGSQALGVDQLCVGDVLVAVNDVGVATVPFATVCNFLKKTNVTCKLAFEAPYDPDLPYTSSSSSSVAADPVGDDAVYTNVASVLEATLAKVQSIEDMVRLSSVMAV
ncbi:hypothetical protein ACHHYP_05650 [Achlya hypogyna]|uniref:PDZ domain-containing protein n=1 Tax=Achlya hypogyna TaxID=1202772 RepID=A0A1V9YXM9_ACHHY|nr:hypothetical protein ACHHYP_05650 [Achlya hypogyna]